MNSKLSDLLQTSTIKNNNCPNCEDVFFLPNEYEVNLYGLKAKTKILEQLRSALAFVANYDYPLTSTDASYISYSVNSLFAVGPLLRLNLQSEICDEGASMIGSHKVMFSNEDGKQYITVKDLAVPKEFDEEYFEDYDQETDLETIYSKPASEFKPAKFEILNFKTMQKDGHILAILDQPLTCLHYGENNKYTESYVRQQLQLLPDLMFEKALEIQGEVMTKNSETNFKTTTKQEAQPTQFSPLISVLANLEKQPAETFMPKSESLQKVSEEFLNKLNSIYAEVYPTCQTKNKLIELDDLADSYVDQFKKIVDEKRILLKTELSEAQKLSQKRANQRIQKISAIVNGEKAKE